MGKLTKEQAIIISAHVSRKAEVMIDKSSMVDWFWKFANNFSNPTVRENLRGVAFEFELALKRPSGGESEICAKRYRFWRYMATIEPREMAKILGPCTTQDDLDVAIDTAICERSDIPLEYHSSCKWNPMNDDNMPGSFDGECGIAWTFTEGGITENGINFCPKCGRRVVT